MTSPRLTPIPTESGAVTLLHDDSRISIEARDRQFGRSCVATLGTAGALALRAALDAHLSTPGVVRRVELAAEEARRLARMAEDGEHGIGGGAEDLAESLDSITASLRPPEGADVPEPTVPPLEPQESEASPYGDLSSLTDRLGEVRAALCCLADASLYAEADWPTGALAAAMQPVLRDIDGMTEALSRAAERIRAVPQRMGPPDRPWAPAA